jgi:hypothetical protein
LAQTALPGTGYGVKPRLKRRSPGLLVAAGPLISARVFAWAYVGTFFAFGWVPSIKANRGSPSKACQAACYPLRGKWQPATQGKRWLYLVWLFFVLLAKAPAIDSTASSIDVFRPPVGEPPYLVAAIPVCAL